MRGAEGVMQADLKTGLYICPVCEEVFELSDELPICETCLSVLEGYPTENTEAEALCPGG